LLRRVVPLRTEQKSGTNAPPLQRPFSPNGLSSPTPSRHICKEFFRFPGSSNRRTHILIQTQSIKGTTCQKPAPYRVRRAGPSIAMNWPSFPTPPQRQLTNLYPSGNRPGAVMTLGFRHIVAWSDEVRSIAGRHENVRRSRSGIPRCTEARFSIGSNSHDKTMRLAAHCGYRVLFLHSATLRSRVLHARGPREADSKSRNLV